MGRFQALPRRGGAVMPLIRGEEGRDTDKPARKAYRAPRMPAITVRLDGDAQAALAWLQRGGLGQAAIVRLALRLAHAQQMRTGQALAALLIDEPIPYHLTDKATKGGEP